MKKILFIIFVLSTANSVKLDEIDALKKTLKWFRAGITIRTKRFLLQILQDYFDHTVLQRVSAISEMLDEYPETLIGVEWHSPSFYGNSDFDISELQHKS